MNWSDYLIPASCNTGKSRSFGEAVLAYQGERDFMFPDTARVAIIGIPEDRFSGGAGEIRSPGAVRKQLYNLSAGSHGTVVDMGDLRTGKTPVDTCYGLRDTVAELYRRGTATLLIGGSIDVFYGNCLATEMQGDILSYVAPRLRLPERGTEEHPLNTLLLGQTDAAARESAMPHICNIGYQSYYVTQQDLDCFADRHFEAYRLGEARSGNLRAVEPVLRDTGLLAVSMEAVRYSDAPAASGASPNGFTGDEICQLAFFAGLGHRCRSMGIFDMLPQNDTLDITAKLAAQMAWYFIEGVKKRNIDTPKNNRENFKSYLIYFDQLHHNLCFYKNILTGRWWVEVPSASGQHDGMIIACAQEDYERAAEQEIPERWWKAYQRIN